MTRQGQTNRPSADDANVAIDLPGRQRVEYGHRATFNTRLGAVPHTN
jgi:hypothetical protein